MPGQDLENHESWCGAVHRVQCIHDLLLSKSHFLCVLELRLPSRTLFRVRDLSPSPHFYFYIIEQALSKKKKTATKKGPVLGSWYVSMSCGRNCLREMVIGRNVWHAKTIRSRSIIKGPKAFFCDRDLSPFSLSYHSALTRGWWRWSTSRTYFHSWQSALFYLL